MEINSGGLMVVYGVLFILVSFFFLLFLVIILFRLTCLVWFHSSL